MREEIIEFFIIKQEVGKSTWLRLVFSPTLLSCSTTSCVLHNRTEHSRGFFIFY